MDLKLSEMSKCLAELLRGRFWVRAYGFSRFVAIRFMQDRLPQIAGSLTFTTLLALIPLLTIALTMISAFPRFELYSTQFKQFLLSNLVPDSAGRVIGIYMRQFTDNADRLTLMGTIMLGLTALLLMFTIDKAFNQGIWRIRRQRKLVYRTVIYWALLTLGPLLLGVSLGQTTAMVGAANGREAGFLASTLSTMAPFCLGWAGLVLLYSLVPNCHVPRRHAMLGALIASIAFEGMKIGFGWYIKHFGNFKLVYGAFASVPIFLLWLYAVWVIVLFGAVLTASLSYWREDAWRKRSLPSDLFHDALRILMVLGNAHSAGQVLDLDEIQRRVHLGFDQLHQLLEKLALRHWVEACGQNRWVLACNLDQIAVKDVFRLLVPLPRYRGRQQKMDAIDRCLAVYQRDIDLALNLSVAELKLQVEVQDDGTLA